jgi:hypothetical protein
MSETRYDVIIAAGVIKGFSRASNLMKTQRKLKGLRSNEIRPVP